MIKSLTLSTAILISLPIAAQANSLENLERERAVTIQTLLDPALDLDNRHARLESQRHRLIDLERMVIRDKSLRGKTDRTTRIAFKDYDATFLSHAAAEKNLTLADHWLSHFNLSTDALMATRMGRR